MMKLNILDTALGISAALLMCCNSRGSHDNGHKGAKLDSDLAKCYSVVVEKDSVILHANMKGDSVSGSLVYKMYEKDHSTGTFQGKMYGDTLRAMYKFVSEGMESVREIAFIKKDSLLIEGYGLMQELDGKTVFANYPDVKFDRIALHESACK